MPPRKPSRSNQTYRPTSKLRPHPQAALVPAMGEPEYAAFRDDIEVRDIQVPIEITVGSGLREVVRLLYDLEHTTKILTVQDVKVRVVGVGQPRDLLTTFTVSGYLLPGAAYMTGASCRLAGTGSPAR